MSQTALTIGTAYTDRYMAGTGTADDPWIIGRNTETSHDLQNLLDAIYTPNAYVKLVKDIEAAKDVTYREGISHAVTIAAAKLYADEKVKVSGLIINGDYGLYCMDSAVHSVERIQFLSMIHNGTKSTLQGSVSTNCGVYFKECDFSIQKNCNGAAAQCVDSAFDFDHCSIEYQAFGYSTSACKIFAPSLRMYYCSISYKGPVFGYGYVSAAMLQNGDHVSVVGDIVTSVSGTYLFNDCRYSYFAGMVDCSVMNTTIGCGLYSSNPQCLMCITETTGSYTLTKNTNITDVTPDQLRDRDYLYSIGFLP